MDTTGIDPASDEIVALCLVACDDDFAIIDRKVLYNKDVDPQLLKQSEYFHKINQAVLEDVGLSEEQFVLGAASFIVEHFLEHDIDFVKCLGHNISDFALPFLRNLFKKWDISIEFSSHVLDTHSVLVPTVGDVNLKQMIVMFGDEDETDEYTSACYKCLLFVNIFKRVKQLWQKRVLK